MNSLAGVITTIANVYGVQHGEFSATSKTTIIVTGGSALICGLAVLYYTFWKLRRVKNKHDREAGVENVGRHGEGIVQESGV